LWGKARFVAAISEISPELIPAVKFFRIRLLTNLLLLYTLLAGIWWSYLLLNKNEAAHRAERALLEHRFEADGTDGPSALAELDRRYAAQRRMILGEGTVLLAVLLLGIWWVNHSVSREAALDRQQNNFLLSVTHELKSPIASIRLVLDTIRMRQLDRAQTERLTGSALNEADRLQSLVENLLLAARIEGAPALHRENIRADELLGGLCDRFAQKYPEARFERFLEPGLRLEADPYALTTIALNLLENAVKYAPSDEKPHIVLRLCTAGKKALLEVADQGTGIQDTEKKRVFDKFYRVGNEETRRAKGTGLGLYLVKGLAEAHRGSVEIRDNVPKGTVFSVLLPLK
jgi:signal transduction histidine kinase